MVHNVPMFDRSGRKPRLSRLAPLAFGGLALIASSCSSSEPTAAPEVADGETGASQTVSEEPVGQRLDPSVLSGEFTTISGETIELGSLADKDLVVWFWAPW